MCIWSPQNSELNIFVDGYNLLNIRRIGESRNILNIFALNVSNDSVKIREFIIIHPRVCTPSIEIQESGESDLGRRESGAGGGGGEREVKIRRCYGDRAGCANKEN